jgi:hypothetical protein
LIFSTEFVLGPSERDVSQNRNIQNWRFADQALNIPMVQMMDVRRKFFAGTISVFSLECHSSFIRLDKWSREELAAILKTSLVRICDGECRDELWKGE